MTVVQLINGLKEIYFANYTSFRAGRYTQQIYYKPDYENAHPREAKRAMKQPQSVNSQSSNKRSRPCSGSRNAVKCIPG